MLVSLMFAFFFDEEPPLSLLPSGSTLDLADRRLAAQDEYLMLRYIRENLKQSGPYGQVGSMFDDTFFANAEQHNIFLTFLTTRRRRPWQN